MSVAGGTVKSGAMVERDMTTTINPAPGRSVIPPTPPWRNALTNWKFWLGIGISVVFLYIALRGQPLGETWAAIRRVQLAWLVPAVAAFFLRVFIAAYRWHILLRPAKDIPISRIWPINVIGFTANNVLPLRAGEALRIYQLGKQEGIPRSGILATLFIERIFDGLALLSLIVLSIALIPVDDNIRALTVTTAAIFFGALAAFFLVAFSGAWRRRLVLPLIHLLPDGLAAKMERRMEEFVIGLGSLRRGSALALVMVTSLASWLAELGTYLCAARAFDIDLGLAPAMLTMGVANLFTLIPSSPGYVGSFEAGTKVVMTQVLGFSGEIALAYALVVHATLYFPVTILGAYYWFRHHLGMGSNTTPAEAKAE